MNWQKWRKKMGWTQLEASKNLGISRRHMQRLEHGDRVASDSLKKLAMMISRTTK